MTTWKEGDVVANGIRLHYHRSGGDKPPIILAHGITDSGRCWPLVSEALAPIYDVISVDARGHGLSEKPEDMASYARDEHAKDLAGLIEALDLQRPAVMGHSMGAANAAVLAYRYPELTSVLVLEDPPWANLGSQVAPAEHTEMWIQRIQDRKAISIDELITEGRQINPTWPPEVFPPWAEAKHQVSSDVVGIIRAEESTWQTIIEGIQCPVLLLTADTDIGEMGAITPPDVAATVEEINPLVEVAYISGAGHNIRREQLDAYIDAVQSFLAKSYPEA